MGYDSSRDPRKQGQRALELSDEQIGSRSDDGERHHRPDQPEQPDFLTVKETARYLRLCEKQVRRLISTRRTAGLSVRNGTQDQEGKTSTPMPKRGEFTLDEKQYVSENIS